MNEKHNGGSGGDSPQRSPRNPDKVIRAVVMEDASVIVAGSGVALMLHLPNMETLIKVLIRRPIPAWSTIKIGTFADLVSHVELLTAPTKGSH